MITKTYRFHVQTLYVNSRVSEDVVLEFEDDATKEEIEQEIQDSYNIWRDQQLEGGWEER